MTLYCELVIAGIVYVLPVILADRYYNDDLGRSFFGSLGWAKDGRPLGGILFFLLCGGRRPIMDISPLPLLLGILILTYSLILYAKENLNVFSNDQGKILVLLFVLTNPFAMSNLSYKYDSLMMLIAIGIPFVIFSIPDTVSLKENFVFSFGGGLMLMSLYQPALGICFVLIMIKYFLFVMNEKNNLIKDGIRIAGILSGVIIYMLFIAPAFVDTQGWRHEQSQMVSRLSLDSVRIIIANIVLLFDYVKNYMFGTSWLYLIVLSMMIICCVGCAFLREIKERCRFWSRIYIISSIVIAFVVTFLPLAVLKVLEMRSRIFIAFGGFFLYVGILLLYLMKKKNKIFNAIIVFLLITCSLFHYIHMYVYGNALKSQKEYEKYIVYNLAHDMESLNADGSYQEITFVGKAPRAKQVQMMCGKYPFLDEIVPTYFGNSTWLGGVWLYHYLQEGLTICEVEIDDIEAVKVKEPVFTNAVYYCYINGRRIIVSFQ